MSLNVIPDLVKIDVEGPEAIVLQGANRLAVKGHTKFFLEMHSNRSLPMVENAQMIIDWCKDHHYQAWYLKRKNY